MDGSAGKTAEEEAGLGYVLRCNDWIKRMEALPLGKNSSQFAELSALKCGLQSAMQFPNQMQELDVYMDSEFAYKVGRGTSVSEDPKLNPLVHSIRDMAKVLNTRTNGQIRFHQITRDNNFLADRTAKAGKLANGRRARWCTATCGCKDGKDIRAAHAKTPDAKCICPVTTCKFAVHGQQKLIDHFRVAHKCEVDIPTHCLMTFIGGALVVCARCARPRLSTADHNCPLATAPVTTTTPAPAQTGSSQVPEWMDLGKEDRDFLDAMTYEESIDRTNTPIVSMLNEPASFKKRVCEILCKILTQIVLLKADPSAQRRWLIMFNLFPKLAFTGGPNSARRVQLQYLADGQIKKAYDTMKLRTRASKGKPKLLQDRAIELAREGQLSKAARVLEDNLQRVSPSNAQVMELCNILCPKEVNAVKTQLEKPRGTPTTKSSPMQTRAKAATPTATKNSTGLPETTAPTKSTAAPTPPTSAPTPTSTAPTSTSTAPTPTMTHRALKTDGMS